MRGGARPGMWSYKVNVSERKGRKKRGKGRVTVSEGKGKRTPSTNERKTDDSEMGLC